MSIINNQASPRYVNKFNFGCIIILYFRSILQTSIINVDENQKTGAQLNSSIKASDPDTTANLTVEIDWASSYATKNSRRVVNGTDWQ